MAEIIESKRKLIKIFIIHLHPDHYLGLDVIKCKYHNVEVVSYSKIAKDINQAYDFKIEYWGKDILKDNGAKSGFKINKTNEKKLYLEGEEIIILGPMSGDCIEITPCGFHP